MKIRKIMPWIVATGIIVLVAGCYLINQFSHEDIYKVLINTDKLTYRAGETIHVRIENFDERTIDIYCPMNCALGNFPTTVEKYADGEWEYFAGFCPSIEPLFGNYPQEGDYIIHSLAPGEAFDLELTNLEGLGLLGEERLKIMYYLNGGRTTISSPEFIVRP
ncbi:MAG: hypothetical protein FIA98_12940 [Anaerolineae bacterium]|nr:hypothetical protein [Anaerolineae bacterium]